MKKICEKIRPSLVGLKVGQTALFSISKLKSVRTQASELGAMLNRKYTTRTDRAKKIIIVARAE
jgi:hypothetical protein